MRVLVTGAAGLLGGTVARALADAGHTVDSLGRDGLDVTDARRVEAVVIGVRPDVVVHCAALTDVDACEADPSRAEDVNAAAPGALAAACERTGARIVHVSTDYVFDGRKGSPYVESDETNPIQVYGRSKLAGEDAVREATDRHHILRSAWIYGPGGKNFLSRLPDAVAEGRTVTAVTDQTGSPTYAPDLARAIVGLIDTDAWGTYHVANEGGCSFADFCSRALEAMGADAAVEPTTLAELGRPAPRPTDTRLEGAAWTEAGFGRLRPWQDAAEDFVREVSRA